MPTIGPNLAELGLNSPFEILARMWKHPPVIEKRMKQGQIRGPLLTNDHMQDLIAHIRSVSQKD